MNPIYRIKKRFRLSKRSKSLAINIARTLMQLHTRSKISFVNWGFSISHFVMTRDRLQGLIICFIGVGPSSCSISCPFWGDYFFHCGELVTRHGSPQARGTPFWPATFHCNMRMITTSRCEPIFLYYTPTYYGIAGLTQIITGLEPYA